MIVEAENHMFYDVDECNSEDKNSHTPLSVGKKQEFLILLIFFIVYWNGKEIFIADYRKIYKGNVH